ncbi:MAG: AAA family ATPase [Hahellaceae bacterium]|nr:AAA family ATPase [Hahellaceae bacterium]MCP5169617.1 AAA family ATPase [Hahellaceae bacterium]
MNVTVPGYRILETLFCSEHTLVVRAERERDNVPVVLKQLCDDFPDPGKISRFLFGYEVAAKFDHPNITKNLDWLGVRRNGDLVEITGEGLGTCKPTIVMEDQGGVDLYAYLKHFENERLPVDIFLTIAVQLAEALSVIHYQQVIHKDLHPGNVLINPNTRLTQITDFGLASLLSREQPVLHAPERLEGVLEYLSPEQTGRMNRALDYRSDFYTLGCTLYHLLTGRPPFRAKDALGVVHAHIARAQVPVSVYRPDVPAVLSDIIDKLLMKTAEDRYQSALGLKKDLDKVYLALAMNKPVPEFPLGMDDISDRLQVPQKLYGRDDEVQILMQRFFQAAGGKPKMLALSGHSGIGKSALVYEVHKPIAAYNGLFCAGKFDQFQKNVPYSALQLALKTWIQSMLSLSEAHRQHKRNEVLNALGANARVLIDFMPDFAWVLGELPPVAQLGADETQNRVHLVFQKLIKAITHEHPLVLFIDDIQWADLGTLNLLPQLLDEDLCRLLIIVAYRDNEVGARHPAMQMFKQIEQSPRLGDSLSLVSLGPLDQSHVAELLSDALHRPTGELNALVNLVYAKTAGNPFFISEFLKALYTENLLNFDLACQRWRWSISEIEDKGITDNVVDLMLTKMAKLPEDTQAMIQLAACVGSRFNLEMLARVAEQPLAKVTRILWPALRDGVLIQDGGDWYLGMVQPRGEKTIVDRVSSARVSQFSPVSPQCRFLHDRMLQAAYQSLPTAQRQQIHLNVGRLLLKGESVAELSDEACFAIVEQLNQARPLIDHPDEKHSLSLLNLRAARQAWAASVWSAAVDYSDIGLSLLPADHWQSDYDTSEQLFTLKAECEYLVGHHEVSERYYDELFRHLQDDLQRAEICTVRMVQAIGHGQWARGLALGKQGLGYVGLSLPPEQHLAEAAAQEEAYLMAHTRDGVIDNVMALPDMDDPKLLVAMRILPNLNACAVIINDKRLGKYCVYKGCNLILDYGKSDVAAIQLVLYACLCLRADNKFKAAVLQGGQAKQLADSYRPCREIANVYSLLGATLFFFNAPFSECIAMNRRGVQLGTENGEIARATMSCCNALFAMISQGWRLPVIEHEAEQAENLVLKNQVFHPGSKIIHQYVCALQGRDADTMALSDRRFDGDFLHKLMHSFHIGYLLHYRSMLAFWSGDAEDALMWVRRTQTRASEFSLNSFTIDHVFFYGLLLVQQAGPLSDEDVAAVTQCLQQLSEFRAVYPVNFAHLHLLLSAEFARVQGQESIRVCALYRDAMEAARQHGFLHLEALANELFGRYWLMAGFDGLAAPLLREAMHLYRQWGCLVRVNWLRTCYEGVLPSLEVKRTYSLTQSESRVSQHNQVLDMASVMKSAQVISGELKLSRLSAKVLAVIVESAGATSAGLVIDQQGVAYVVARVSEDEHLTTFESPILLDESENLPVNIIRYVLNSDEAVNIGDVMTTRTFANDPYLLKHQPRAVLCLPIEYRDKVFGALYLENSLTIDAFTPDRLDVINLLLAQAAISYDNAQLFNEVSQLNQTLEDKVEQRTRDLNRAVKNLELVNEELNSFSYSVSHDLRAPLRGISGFSRMLEEDYSEVLDEDGKDLIGRIVRNVVKMQELIEGLLTLSRVQRKELEKESVDLSSMVSDLFTEMQSRFPEQKVVARYAGHCTVQGDKRMLYSALENLINNAWKYSSKTGQSFVEFGQRVIQNDSDIPEGVGHRPDQLMPGSSIYFIKDNGAGFDMSRAVKLFGTFQRLHSDNDFAGTGVGLATVKRIIEKHGGYIWASAKPGEGATFYFVL